MTIPEALDARTCAGLITRWQSAEIGQYRRYLVWRGDDVTSFNEWLGGPLVNDPGELEQFLREGVLPCLSPPQGPA